MTEIWFSLISFIFISCLAITDGLFNRLVFREHRKLSYQSVEKKPIYKMKEWGYIGIIFLIIIPVLIPSVFSFLIGGEKYLLIYWFWLSIIQWDMIFGKLVFDDWWGDSPSIAIPHRGWITLPIKPVVLTRIGLAIIIGLILLKFYF